MADFRPRRRLVPIWKWPTKDWEREHVGYRFIKATAQHPVEWIARIQSKGANHIPADGPVILGVNHYSWADPVVVGAVIDRPAHYLAKEGVFKNAVAAHFLRAFGQIKVDRALGGNDAAIDTAVRALSEDLVVGVFPEATRSRPGQVRRGKTGIARIAALSGAPVVPIACDTQDFWPRNRALPDLGERVYVNVGEPMALDLKPEDADNRDLMRDATDRIMARIRVLLSECERAKEAGEKWN